MQSIATTILVLALMHLQLARADVMQDLQVLQKDISSLSMAERDSDSDLVLESSTGLGLKAPNEQAAADEKGSSDYGDIYENVYKNGYHNDIDLSHAKDLVPAIARDFKGKLTTILDVGCAGGWAVQKLHESGFRAQGIDIAPTAIEHAKEWRACVKSNECQVQVASATKLPQADGSVDAVMSTDVPEHIYEKDVPLMVAEFKRVTNKYVFLKPAGQHELDTKDLDEAHQRGELEDVKHLHATVQNQEWWSKQFEASGFKSLGSLGLPGVIALEKIA